MTDQPNKEAAMHFNELTPAEAERLALLLEEMGEVQQIVGKILRHGYASRNPHEPNGQTNRQLLEREMGDLSHAIALLRNAGDVTSSRILEHAARKAEKVGPYLHHQVSR